MKVDFQGIRKIIRLTQRLAENEAAEASQIKESLLKIPGLCVGSTPQADYVPILSVVGSLLTDSARGMDREKILHGVHTLQTMVNNLESDAAHLNEKVQQEFFKHWFPPDLATHEGQLQDDTLSPADFLSDDDDIDKFFATEVQEITDKMRFYVQELGSPKRWRTAVSELRGLAHTLKGSAAIIGDKVISSVAHSFEEALHFNKQPSPSAMTLFAETCSTFLWLVSHGESEPEKRKNKSDAILKALREFQEPQQISQKSIMQRTKSTGGVEAPQRVSSGQIVFERLSLLLDDADASKALLMEDISQLRSIGKNIARGIQALEDLLNEFKALAVGNDVATEISNLDARTAEVLSDLDEYFRLLDQRFEGCQDSMDKIQEVSTGLWREIVHSRRIPIGRMFGILQKTVTELSTEQGVEAKLSLSGGDIQVEKKVFETLFDPLLQLIRNAISHAMEPATERCAQGKPAVGRIDVGFSSDGDDFIIQVADDGRGLHSKKLTALARRQGLLDKGGSVGDENVIFISGLTSREDISEVAGRGIGMDVVATGLKKLNGMIQVKSRDGEGAQFHIRIPASPFYTTAYVVRAGSFLFSLPAALVHGRHQSDQLFFCADDYPRISLSRVLGGGPGERTLLVGAVEKRFYLEVDEVIGEQPAVLSRLGRFFKGLPLVWGATLMHEGEMAFVLNLRDFFDTATKLGRRQSKKRQPGRRKQAYQRAPILVVDDSITVRQYVERSLRKHGYEVDVASGGDEALEFLARQQYTLVITDLEMPGMDGYALMRKIQQLEAWRRLPLIVITTRMDAAQKQQALDSGAELLLTKPFSEKQLLRSVRTLLS